MRVLVVADILLFRQGVAEALRALPDVENAVTSSTGPSAVVMARRFECHAAVVDMTKDGYQQTVVGLLAARPGIKVIALGVPEDGAHVVASAEAGVTGYVSKDANIDDLADALRAALRGEAACPGKIAAGLIDYIAVQARSRRAGDLSAKLTRREREILRLLETELSNKEIARALDLQLSTVKNHVHNVLVKVGAADRHNISVVLAGGAEQVKDPVLPPRAISNGDEGA